MFALALEALVSAPAAVLSMAEAPVAVHSCRLEVLADTADWIAVHVAVGLLVEFSHSSDNLIVPQLHRDNRIGPRKLSSLRES